MSMSLGTLYLEIATNLSALHTGLREASSKIETWAAQSRQRMKPFEDSALGMAAAATGIGLALAGASNAFGEFQAKLNGVASVSGATAEEIERIREASLKMGGETKFSAKEAADGFYELGKAGFTASEQLATMPGVVNLASAAQTGIGEAAETTAGILRGFGLAAGQAGLVADQLAKAANASAVDVSDLAESMKYIAPMASASNQPLHEMNGILAVLGNNMIKGSQAGTSMRAMLVALQKPNDEAAAIMAKLGISIQDTNGKMLPMTDVIAQLRTTMAGYTETQKSAALAQIFGQESLSAVMALMNQAPGSIEKTVASMKNASGAAEEMAEGLNKGSKYMREQFFGAIDTLAIKIGGDLEPAVEALFKGLTKLVDVFSGMPTPVRYVALAIAGVTFALAGLSAAIGTFSTFLLPQFVAGFKALWLMLGKTTLAVRAFMAAWGPWALLATAVVAGIALIQTQLQGLHDDLDAAAEAQKRFNDAVTKLTVDGGAAWRKHAEGAKLTKDEARAALLYIKQLQTEAGTAGNSALAAKRAAQAKELQAILDRGGDVKAAGRGAAVVDPQAATKAAEAQRKADKAASDALAKKEDAAQANLDNRLAANTKGGGGAAGEVKAYQAYRAELIKAGSEKTKIAAIDKQIAELIAKQAKSEKDKNLDKAEDQLKKNLALNEEFGGGLAGQVKHYETYLEQLKKAHADTGKIADIEKKILDLKKDQATKTREMMENGLKAAQQVGGMFANGLSSVGGENLGDKGGSTATAGALAGNAGTIMQLPELLTDMAKGLQAAIPTLSAALPALAPMFTALSTSLTDFLNGGLSALIPIIGAIVAAFTLLMEVWNQNAGGIQDAIGNLLAALGSLWEGVMGFLTPVIQSLGASFSILANTLAVVVSVVSAVFNGINHLAKAIGDFLMSWEPLRAAVDAVVNIFKALWDGLAKFVETITFGAVKLKGAGENAANREALKGNSAGIDYVGMMKSAFSDGPGSLSKSVGSAVKSGVEAVMGSFSSSNPLPVAEQSRTNIFGLGPAFRHFVEKSSRVSLDLTINGQADKATLLQLANDPEVRQAWAGAVSFENSTAGLVPRFS